MTYGARATVKTKLGIPASTTDHDTEIDNLLAEASRLIDSKFRQIGVGVPLSSASDEVNDSCNNIAAGYFNEQQEVVSRGRAEMQDALTKRGILQIDEYIKGYCRGTGEGAAGNGPNDYSGMIGISNE